MAEYQFEVFTGRGRNGGWLPGGRGSRGGSACGTRSGYTAGCRCVGCRAANTAYGKQERVRRAERLRSGDANVVHGKYTTYQNWGCRCIACTEANSAKCAKFARRRASLSGVR
jgi:hypothetical protein